MGEDDEVQRIREERMRQLQQQAMAQQQQAQQMQELDHQKAQIMSVILDSAARSRLNTIKLARPEFAEEVEMQLIQLYQMGRLRGMIPMTDDKFRQILVQLQNSNQTREFNIKFK